MMVWHREKAKTTTKQPQPRHRLFPPTLCISEYDQHSSRSSLMFLGWTTSWHMKPAFRSQTAVAWFEGQFLLCLLEAKRAAVTVSEFDSRRSHSCSRFPAPSAPSALCDLKPPSVSHTVACFLLKMHCAPVQGFHFYLLSDWKEMHHKRKPRTMHVDTVYGLS